MAGKELPDGRYHVDRMIGSAARHGADIGYRATCMDARGEPGRAGQGTGPIRGGGAHGPHFVPVPMLTSACSTAGVPAGAAG